LAGCRAGGFGVACNFLVMVTFMIKTILARCGARFPGFFTSLGRSYHCRADFNALDDQNAEPVVIVSATLARQMFPVRIRSIGMCIGPIPCSNSLPAPPPKRRDLRRRTNYWVAADMDDEHIVPVPTATIYGALADGGMFGGHVFIHTMGNPYSLVTPVTKIIRIWPLRTGGERPPRWKTFARRCWLRIA